MKTPTSDFPMTSREEGRGWKSRVTAAWRKGSRSGMTLRIMRERARESDVHGGESWKRREKEESRRTVIN